MQGLPGKVATLNLSGGVTRDIYPGIKFVGVSLMKFRAALILLALLATPVAVQAGDPIGSFIMTFSSSSVVQGGQAAVDFSFSHSDPSGVQGFSFGVCHSMNVLELEPVGSEGDFDEVVDWSSTVETLKQGSAPDFFQQNLETGGP